MERTLQNQKIDEQNNVFVDEAKGLILTKICSACGARKTLEQFYFKKTEGRYESQCKSCVSKKKSTLKKEKALKAKIKKRNPTQSFSGVEIEFIPEELSSVWMGVESAIISIIRA